VRVRRDLFGVGANTHQHGVRVGGDGTLWWRHQPDRHAAALDLPPLERLEATTVPTPGAPATLLSAFGSLWVMSHRGTVLRRIDPASSKVTASVDTGVLGCGDWSRARSRSG
jgi:streptogramin lyase